MRTAPARARAPVRVVCQAVKPEAEQRNVLAAPVAGLVAAALLTSAFVPDEALAAKSGGRVGGSTSSFSRSRASSSTRVNAA